MTAGTLSDPSCTVATMNQGHRSADGNRGKPKDRRRHMCARDELEFLVPLRVAALFRADDGRHPGGQRSPSHAAGVREVRGPDAVARLVRCALSDPFGRVHRHPERKVPTGRDRKS